jgi:ribosomal protein S27AE
MDRDMTLRALFVAPNGGMVSAAWRLCQRCGVTIGEGPGYWQCAVCGVVVREAGGT